MDSQSTTPVDPRVLEAMLPYFTEKFGHPASRNHPFGWEAEGGVDKAREQIAKLIGARDPKEIVFTSGGTESINLALKGVAEMYREKGNHIVTTTIEQRASLDVCKRLERQGFEVTYVPGGPRRAGGRGGGPGGAHRQDHPDLGHVRQQRDRHDPADGRDRQARQGEGDRLPHRRDPGGGQDPGRRRGDGHRPPVRHRPHACTGPRASGALYVRRKNPRVRLAAHDGRRRPRARACARARCRCRWWSASARRPRSAARCMGEEGKRLAALRDRLQDLILSKVDEAYRQRASPSGGCPTT